MVLWQNCLLFLTLVAVGGAIREATDEEFPFQVSIKTIDRRHLCGGAIITSKWVLTASSCLENYPSVTVCYGSSDSNGPQGSIRSRRISRQGRLALIELESTIEFSKTAKQAKLPTQKAQLFNTTKLSGWKVDQFADVPPSLYVVDRYLVVPKDCKRPTGSPVFLAIDEFCGMDEEFQNELSNPGSIVSKGGVALGILTTRVLTPTEPFIYVKLSEHDQWFKDVLQADAQHISWVDVVPKDSAPSQSTVSLALMGISAIFLRYF